ncbi:MAG: S41 family peptidase [Rikenellaceae bacterium]|nr:S41 family peptidase [Rikenellaceae bacterium]
MKFIARTTLLFFFSCATVFSQHKTISRAEAQADIDTLIRVVYETHPDMYAAISREAFEEEVEKVKSALPDSLTILEFYKQAGLLLPLLQDGHTSMQLPSELRKNGELPVFPYPLIPLADSTFRIPGSPKTILSINGVPSNAVMETILRYNSGESVAFRMKRNEDYLPALIALLYPAEQYTIAYSLNGEKFTETREPEPWKNVQSKPTEPGFDYRYEFLEDKNCMYLDFREFNNTEKFAALLASLFGEIQKRGVAHLIVDLRRNGGGNSELGDELLQYISPVPFRQYGDVTVRYSDPVRSAYPDWGLQPENAIVHYSDNELIPLRPNPYRFAGHGKVYLLTRKETFSATADLAWAVQFFGAGKIVGEETGGWIVCFKDSITRRLAHSGLSYDVSWKKFYGYGAANEHTHGVLPDYPVAEEEALTYTLERLIL